MVTTTKAPRAASQNGTFPPVANSNRNPAPVIWSTRYGMKAATLTSATTAERPLLENRSDMRSACVR